MGTTLSITLPNYGTLYPRDGWHEFVDLARDAEDAGCDRIIVVDHVVMGDDLGEYVWGTFPTAPDGPWLEPLTMLAAIASVTKRARLATGVLIAPLRPAVVLAKQVATLDLLSRGRLDLGVGTGWQRHEYAAAGLDFEARGQLLDDTLAACRALWRDTPADLESPSFSFHRVYCEPKPLQVPGVPVWIGGTLHRRNLQRVVTYGSGWIPIMNATVSEIADGVTLLRDRLRDAGRSPDAVTVQAPLRIVRDDRGRPDFARSMSGVAALEDAGVTDVRATLASFVDEVHDARPLLGSLVDAFRSRTAWPDGPPSNAP